MCAFAKTNMLVRWMSSTGDSHEEQKKEKKRKEKINFFQLFDLKLSCDPDDLVRVDVAWCATDPRSACSSLGS